MAQGKQQEPHVGHALGCFLDMRRTASWAFEESSDMIHVQKAPELGCHSAMSSES